MNSILTKNLPQLKPENVNPCLFLPFLDPTLSPLPSNKICTHLSHTAALLEKRESRVEVAHQGSVQSLQRLLTIYLRLFKVGDYVDVKENGSIHNHKFYHGRTGRAWNLTKRAVGVEENKQGVPANSKKILESQETFAFLKSNLCGVLSSTYLTQGPGANFWDQDGVWLSSILQSTKTYEAFESFYGANYQNDQDVFINIAQLAMNCGSLNVDTGGGNTTIVSFFHGVSAPTSAVVTPVDLQLKVKSFEKVLLLRKMRNHFSEGDNNDKFIHMKTLLLSLNSPKSRRLDSVAEAHLGCSGFDAHGLGYVARRRPQGGGY